MFQKEPSYKYELAGASYISNWLINGFQKEQSNQYNLAKANRISNWLINGFQNEPIQTVQPCKSQLL